MYIPKLYAPSTLVKYYAKSVVTAISNTKYEGQVTKQGDAVRIRTRPDITIRDRLKGAALQIETPSSAPVILEIDQAKYYAFVIDDIDEVQADIVLADEFTEDSAEQMRIAVDTDVLGAIYVDADAANQGTSAGKISQNLDLGATGDPLAVTKQNALEVLELLGLVKDEQNVPETNRWTVLPAWFRFLIMNSDAKNAALMGETPSIIRNGRVGMIDREMLYASNLLATTLDGTTTVTNIISGQMDAVTYAAQLTKNEAVRLVTEGFGWLYKGEYVYGYKVVKPEGLVHLYAYKG